MQTRGLRIQVEDLPAPQGRQEARWRTRQHATRGATILGQHSCSLNLRVYGRKTSPSLFSELDCDVALVANGVPLTVAGTLAPTNFSAWDEVGYRWTGQLLCADLAAFGDHEVGLLPGGTEAGLPLGAVGNF